MCTPFQTNQPIKQLADKAADEGVDEEALGLQVFMAPSRQEGDPCKKPATGMWDFMLQNCNDGKAAGAGEDCLGSLLRRVGCVKDVCGGHTARTLTLPAAL